MGKGRVILILLLLFASSVIAGTEDFYWLFPVNIIVALVVGYTWYRYRKSTRE
jgi:general stress protein CsbA